MIELFDDLPHDAVIGADICIIGAGAAGLLMAREFLNTGIRVIVLESGGWKSDAISHDLSAGDIRSGAFRGLQEGRARTFGGATTLWGGQCIRLDPLDLEVRSWVPFSGWPIAWKDLSTYYDRAYQRLGYASGEHDKSALQNFGIDLPRFNERKLRTIHSFFIRNPDLGKRYQRELAAASNIRVILCANVVQLETNSNGTRVGSARVRSVKGKVGRVAASQFVLCAGGIENARLMLLSDETIPHGIGNGRDLVGRFFQDHPCGLCATIETKSPRRLQDLYNFFYGRRGNYLPKIALSETAQRDQGVLNCVGRLVYEYAPGSGLQVAKDIAASARSGQIPGQLPRKLTALARSLPTLANSAWRYGVKGYSPAARPTRIYLEAFSEQVPNPASRVGLSDSLDRLGLRKVQVDWRIDPLSVTTLQLYVANVKSEFQRLGLGSVEVAPWVDSLEGCRAEMMDSFHHAGTTRMAESAISGVVDRDCKVFGIDGLFVAGSSVFPTSGAANPTFTIAALALRLTDHLKREYARAKEAVVVGRQCDTSDDMPEVVVPEPVMLEAAPIASGERV